jgi:hypothetical protein
LRLFSRRRGSFNGGDFMHRSCSRWNRLRCGGNWFRLRRRLLASILAPLPRLVAVALAISAPAIPAATFALPPLLWLFAFASAFLWSRRRGFARAGRFGLIFSRRGGNRFYLGNGGLLAKPRYRAISGCFLTTA